MAGVLSGLSALKSEYGAVVACDTPFLKAGLLEHLFEVAEGFNAAIPSWQDGSLEPLLAIYNVGRTKKVLEELNNTTSSLQLAMRKLSHLNRVHMDELRRFDPDLVSLFNINSKSDLDIARKLMGRLPESES